jgi:hypothetical protein
MHPVPPTFLIPSGLRCRATSFSGLTTGIFGCESSYYAPTKYVYVNSKRAAIFREVCCTLQARNGRLCCCYIILQSVVAFPNAPVQIIIQLFLNPATPPVQRGSISALLFASETRRPCLPTAINPVVHQLQYTRPFVPHHVCLSLSPFSSSSNT